MSWREWFKEKSIVNRVVMPGGEIFGTSDAEEQRYKAYKARLIEELQAETLISDGFVSVAKLKDISQNSGN